MTEFNYPYDGRTSRLTLSNIQWEPENYGIVRRHLKQEIFVFHI